MTFQNCCICPNHFNCVGMQYNYYTQRYVCPTEMTKADNKTTMCDGIVLYGTESKDGTDAR